MPNPNAKQPQNVSGRFYVDTNCIDCDVCRDLAEANFTRYEDGGYSYVYKQPTTPAEESLCQEALEVCPVEAIGKIVDGSQKSEDSRKPKAPPYRLPTTDF